MCVFAGLYYICTSWSVSNILLINVLFEGRQIGVGRAAGYIGDWSVQLCLKATDVNTHTHTHSARWWRRSTSSQLITTHAALTACTHVPSPARPQYYHYHIITKWTVCETNSRSKTSVLKTILGWIRRTHVCAYVCEWQVYLDDMLINSSEQR